MIENNRLRDVQLVAFDFDGVFTDNRVITSQDGTESVSCWRSDGIGISRLNKIGIKTVIISTETNPVVKIRAEKLKIQCATEHFKAITGSEVQFKHISSFKKLMEIVK